jgi:hypothetical protein
MSWPGARGWLVVLVAFGVALGAVLLLRGGDDPGAADRPPSVVASGSTAGAAEPSPARQPVEAELSRVTTVAAREDDGVVQAAVMLDGWRTPVAAASEPVAALKPMRMWSIAKVVTAVALLRQLGWGRRPGVEPSPQVAEAMHDALVRSENCRQRRLVLELQRLTGGPAGARAAIAETLALAGARADLRVEVEPPESICLEYLGTQEGSVPDPFAPTLLLGTATWGIGDLVAFLHTLGRGAYGIALKERLLPLMRLPKGRSAEVPSSEFTADLDWGAGRALAGLDPAYKAGWGGTLQGAFLAAQGAILELPGKGTMALGVAFHPDAQPPRDDPGLTAAPAALESVMRAMVEGRLARALGTAGSER